MKDYLIVPRKKSLVSEVIMAESPKQAVEIYASMYNIPFSKIEKVTRKVLKRYNVEVSKINDFIDFEVQCDFSLRSGGMYKIV